jgi:hypothetical protein
MKTFALAAVLVLPVLAATLPTHAQSGGATPAREAAQFDFLVGQWEVALQPKIGSLAKLIHGQPTLTGSWKAWRAFDGMGVDDELRVVDGSGNPATLTHAQRIYDAKAQRWLISSLDVYRVRFSSATAQWQGGEMRVDGSGTSADGKPMLTRTRFHDITADGFKMRQDRSTDNGASWDEGALVIVAKRVAAKAPR